MSLVGQRLGSYDIVEEIGQGGMADVYRAYQRSVNRYVAIKVLPPAYARDKTFVQRFLQEASTAARLEHPNIVPIYEAAEQDGLYYIVMRYLEGETLKELIERGGALPLARVRGIVRQLAKALDYAHSEGVVHRDIKPSNIFIGKNDHVTLADFGIARASEATRLTRTGTLLGTPEYMSPEQAKGGEIDRRTDIYSLGIVVYEMLTGRVPFQASTPHGMLHAQVYEQAPPPRTLNPTLPLGVDNVLSRALAKEPRQRFSSATEFAQALSRPADATLKTTVTRQPGTGLRPRVFALALGLVCLIILAVAGAAAVRNLGHDGGSIILTTGNPMSSAAVVGQPASMALDSGTGSRTPHTTAMPTATISPSSEDCVRATITIEQGQNPFWYTGLGPAAGCYDNTGDFLNDIGLALGEFEPGLVVTFWTRWPVDSDGKLIAPTPTPTVTRTATRTPRPRPTTTPTATISADPTVYDNFNDPARDGSLNWGRWSYWSELPNDIAQRDGVLVVNQESGKRGEATALVSSRYNYDALTGPTFFEASLLLEEAQGEGCVEVKLDAHLPDGGIWFSTCHIWPGDWAACHDSLWPEQEDHAFSSGGKSVDRGTWHKFRIEVDPGPMSFWYYIDGEVAGSHVPVDADRLRDAKFALVVGVSGQAVSARIDDVRIGPLGGG